RAAPEAAVPGAMAAEQVPGRVRLDLEPRLAQPARGELERRVLLGAAVGAVGAGPAADRVQLLDPVEDPLDVRHYRERVGAGAGAPRFSRSFFLRFRSF